MSFIKKLLLTTALISTASITNAASITNGDFSGGSIGWSGGNVDETFISMHGIYKVKSDFSGGTWNKTVDFYHGDFSIDFGGTDDNLVQTSIGVVNNGDILSFDTSVNGYFFDHFLTPIFDVMPKEEVGAMFSGSKLNVVVTTDGPSIGKTYADIEEIISDPWRNWGPDYNFSEAFETSIDLSALAGREAQLAFYFDFGKSVSPYSNMRMEGEISFDLDNVRITNPVPVPAAAWLFGSALLGLGFVRKK
ncbi:MAG: VPLPA-CTERM sorting domain-containing protein [Pseudomonadota bacterium]|nr:VPLPA-CTERM sorting domain-containing protein [Pseudomonadota bacterium]